MKVRKPAKRLNSNQLSYLKSLFEEGITNRKKHDPNQVAKNMHKERKPGDRNELRFRKDEYLTAQQIMSQWSKIARCRREQIPEGHCTYEQLPPGEEGDIEVANNQHYLEHPILAEPADAEDLAREAIDGESCEMPSNDENSADQDSSDANEDEDDDDNSNDDSSDSDDDSDNK